MVFILGIKVFLHLWFIQAGQLMSE